MPKEIDLKHAIVVGKKFMGALNALSELTGYGPADVLKRAVAMYREIKLRERDGYFPAVVKDGTATRLKEKS